MNIQLTIDALERRKRQLDLWNKSTRTDIATWKVDLVHLSHFPGLVFHERPFMQFMSEVSIPRDLHCVVKSKDLLAFLRETKKQNPDATMVHWAPASPHNPHSMVGGSAGVGGPVLYADPVTPTHNPTLDDQRPVLVKTAFHHVIPLEAASTLVDFVRPEMLGQWREAVMYAGVGGTYMATDDRIAGFTFRQDTVMAAPSELDGGYHGGPLAWHHSTLRILKGGTHTEAVLTTLRCADEQLEVPCALARLGDRYRYGTLVFETFPCTVVDTFVESLMGVYHRVKPAAAGSGLVFDRVAVKKAAAATETGWDAPILEERKRNDAILLDLREWKFRSDGNRVFEKNGDWLVSEAKFPCPRNYWTNLPDLIRLDKKLVMQALSFFKDKEVEVTFMGHHDPVYITGYHDEGRCVVLMPMYLPAGG